MFPHLRRETYCAVCGHHDYGRPAYYPTQSELIAHHRVEFHLLDSLDNPSEIRQTDMQLEMPI